MAEQEQNRTEEATPFKLRKAREKGQVARGTDLGFVGSLVALAGVALFAGPGFAGRLAELMRLSITADARGAGAPAEALATIRALYWAAFEPLLVLGLALILLVALLEAVQLRGFLFTAAPLKPDFSRLNPARGLKRLFSMKMLKETLKNLLKLAVYGGIAWLTIDWAIAAFGNSVGDAGLLAKAMASAGARLMFAFIGAALLFMVIDQLIVRGEYRKQMRMSRRELTRENREREGEPRLKQKRRQLHEEMREQAEGLGRLDGSDFLVTNPQHYAVALSYRSGEMDAPVVSAKGRNHFAQLLKRKAHILGLPVIADPALARALYRDCPAEQTIQARHFHGVARHYVRLRRDAAGETPEAGREAILG